MKTAIDRFGDQPHLRMKDGVLVFTGEVGDARDALQRVRSERLRKAGGLE